MFVQLRASLYFPIVGDANKVVCDNFHNLYLPPPPLNVPTRLRSRRVYRSYKFLNLCTNMKNCEFGILCWQQHVRYVPMNQKTNSTPVPRLLYHRHCLTRQQQAPQCATYCEQSPPVQFKFFCSTLTQCLDCKYIKRAVVYTSGESKHTFSNVV